jgi:hypothetical protein
MKLVWHLVPYRKNTFDIYMCKGDYIIVWRCVPYRQNSFDWFSRWPWNTLRNYAWCLSLQEGVGESALGWGARSADCVCVCVCGGGGGKGRETVNRKRKLSAVFLQSIQNPSYINTYCCYAYHFYAYWLYFIYVWHVYVSPKTYKWVGTFIIKDGKYTFTFL